MCGILLHHCHELSFLVNKHSSSDYEYLTVATGVTTGTTNKNIIFNFQNRGVATIVY